VSRSKNGVENDVLGTSFVITSRISALVIAVIAGSVVLTPQRAHAQWWRAHGPVDFEECADVAEKAATKETKAAALSECNAKFAGRRKPGGGYSYFDFMQNRNFDIAGPNPTPEEQKHIDEQYTDFLDRERRSTIAAAFAAKQQLVEPTTFKGQTEKKSETEKASAPAQALNKPSAAGKDIKRIKATNCASHSFSCDWPELSEKINDLKKLLFGSSSSKAKRG
jgi:hypothetical protein